MIIISRVLLPPLELGNHIYSPNVTSYSRTCSCENDTLRTNLNSSFLLMDLLPVTFKSLASDPEPAAIFAMLTRELLRQLLSVLSVHTLRTGLLAADAVKVASSSSISGMQTWSNLGRSRRFRPTEAAVEFGLEDGGVGRRRSKPEWPPFWGKSERREDRPPEDVWDRLMGFDWRLRIDLLDFLQIIMSAHSRELCESCDTSLGASTYRCAVTVSGASVVMMFTS